MYELCKLYALITKYYALNLEFCINNVQNKSLYIKSVLLKTNIFQTLIAILSMNIKIHIVSSGVYLSVVWIYKNSNIGRRDIFSKRPQQICFMFYGHQSRKTIIIGQINRNIKRLIFGFECNEEYTSVIHFF